MKLGKKCSSCGQANDTWISKCKACGNSLSNAGEGKFDKAAFKVERSENEDDKNSFQYRSNYGTARGVSGFIAFIGWLVVFAGFIGIFLAIDTGVSALMFGLGTVISGLFLVMGAQVTQATVDNADHSREILNLLSQKMNDNE